MTAGAVPDGVPDRALARAAKAHVQAMLAGDARVNGIGLTRVSSSWAVKVNVATDDELPELPPTVDGVPVEVVHVGRITPRGA
ncbi:hypothetical protein [Kineococcus sp. SYSU DK004]|uniref:hypothetical protein n=1 Tax=Kineococcus sp. SYSU DK004 TaxID=3383125 RepID=UPI003D7CBD3D